MELPRGCGIIGSGRVPNQASWASRAWIPAPKSKVKNCYGGINCQKMLLYYLSCQKAQSPKYKKKNKKSKSQKIPKSQVPKSESSNPKVHKYKKLSKSEVPKPESSTTQKSESPKLQESQNPQKRSKVPKSLNPQVPKSRESTSPKVKSEIKFQTPQHVTQFQERI